MKNKKRAAYALIASIFLFCFILNSKTVIHGAAEAVELCLKTLIPTLFPFLVITSSCSTLLLGVRSRILQILLKPCKIPNGAEIIFLLGLIGGYPLGAKLLSEACHTRAIGTKDAQRMLMFCNNAGPSFILGILGTMFPETLIPWIVWEIHILSAYLVGVFTANQPNTHCTDMPSGRFQINKTITSAVAAMGSICAWVTLFRVILVLLEGWVLCYLPAPLRVLFSGLLELSNGCVQLIGIQNIKLRFIVALLIISFGGTCIIMQTAALVPKGIVKYYLIGKLQQTAIALILSVPVVMLMKKQLLCLICVPLIGLFLIVISCIGKQQKKQ